MKPFLLVSTRPEEEALDSEYQAYVRASGLDPDDLKLAEFDLVGLPLIEPELYSGVFVAGSPYGASATDGYISQTQQWVRSELRDLFAQLLDAKTPLLATGTSITILADLLGGQVSSENAEYAEIVDIEVDRDAADDPLLTDVPSVFQAYVNHGEAVDALPPDTVRLARSLNTPVQIFKYKDNVYAVQFNPELDAEAIHIQLEGYADSGDSGLGDSESLVAIGRHGTGSHKAGNLLSNFVERFRTE